VGAYLSVKVLDAGLLTLEQQFTNHLSDPLSESECRAGGRLLDIGLCQPQKESGPTKACAFASRVVRDTLSFAGCTKSPGNFDRTKQRLLIVACSPSTGLPMIDDMVNFQHTRRHASREKGSGLFSRNGPQGASQNRVLTPFHLIATAIFWLGFLLTALNSGVAFAQTGTLAAQPSVRRDTNNAATATPPAGAPHFARFDQRITGESIGRPRRRAPV
jgi:hypothetical protein